MAKMILESPGGSGRVQDGKDDLGRYRMTMWILKCQNGLKG